ncbi:hypothetical protein B7P43_G08058 [Cryptotermes secundus]|nr:hypothetical protein B7P43_G08058 [Cryptotermes secundus]
MVSNLTATGGFESQSSDSDFGGNCPPVKSSYKNSRGGTVATLHNSATLKLSSGGSSSSSVGGGTTGTASIPMSAADRLSVRTELSSLGGTGCRKPVALNPSEEAKDSRLHYFPSDSGGDGDLSAPLSKSFDEAADVISSNSPSGGGLASSSIQDQIIATQLRRLNRELTPTISDVYHERSIGLGLAPPLSKLLIPSRGLQGNSKDVDTSGSDALLDKLGLLPDENSKATDGKSWLSSTALQQFGGDLSAAELEGKQRSGGSPCSELSRRDEGDGRSIADSQCSAGSYNKPMTSVLQRANSVSVMYFAQDLNETKGQQQAPRVVSFLEDVSALNTDRQDDTNVKPPLRIASSAPVPPCPRSRASKQPPPPIPNSRTATSAAPTKKFPSQC